MSDNNLVKLLYNICGYSPPPIALPSTELTTHPPSIVLTCTSKSLEYEVLLLWWWTILDGWWWHKTVVDIKMVVLFSVPPSPDYWPILDHRGDPHMPDENAPLNQWIQRSSRGVTVDNNNLGNKGRFLKDCRNWPKYFLAISLLLLRIRSPHRLCPLGFGFVCKRYVSRSIPPNPRLSTPNLWKGLFHDIFKLQLRPLSDGILQPSIWWPYHPSIRGPPHL